MDKPPTAEELRALRKVAATANNLVDGFLELYQPHYDGMSWEEKMNKTLVIIGILASNLEEAGYGEGHE